MLDFADLKPGTRVRGLLAGTDVDVIAVEPAVGKAAMAFAIRAESGGVTESTARTVFEKSIQLGLKNPTFED